MQENTIIKYVSNNLALIGVIVALIVQWTTLRNTIESHEDRIKRLEDRSEVFFREMSEIRVGVAELKGIMKAVEIQLETLNEAQ